MGEPEIEIGEDDQPVAASQSTRKHIWTWLRRAAVVAFVLGVTPLVLTFFYRLPFVHPISTLMMLDVATFQGYDRRWVDLEDVAPVLIRSVVVSEDGQFCWHRGVDWAELNVVIDDIMSGEGMRGASTIPMQTVKNLYLWHRPLGAVRKLVELPLAVWFDYFVTKRRIMEIYLNIAEWGPGIYGIEAAAQHHFGRSAAKLTARQAALLAVTLPNPIGRDPAKPSDSLSRLAATIERRASQAGGQVSCLK